MLRVNEYVNAVQNDTNNGWDDGATSDNGGGKQSPSSSLWDDVKSVVSNIFSSIGEHYNNNAKQTWENMKDENGNVTADTVSQYDGSGDSSNAYGNSDYESSDNPFVQALNNPSYDERNTEGNGTFGGNLRRDVNDWGNTVAADASAVYNSGGADGKWKLYEDAIANPAMKVAATPFLPGQARVVAGLAAAPDFISSLVSSGQQGYDNGGVTGGLEGVVNSLVVQPLEQLTQAALHPIDTAESIQEHPANLWNNVLEPGMVAEMGVRGGKKVYDNRQAIGDFASDARNEGVGNAVFDRTAGRNFDDAGDNYVHSNDGVDTTRQEPQAEPQDYTQEQPAAEPAEQPTFSTGVDSNVDAMVANAAAKYQVDPALLAKLVDQESTYGRDQNAGGNLAQVSSDLAARYGLDVNNPAQSIEAGARYLKEQLDANGGDSREALAAYNAGPGNKQAGYGYADSVLGRDIGGDIGKSDAYSAGANAWMGERMPSGDKGCVEAATRVGSYYDDFLKQEADKGQASVPGLVADAGDRVIPFDDSKLEKGDIIVYGDRDHVVTYDGNGGYVGNSTSQGRIVHGSDYREMGDLQPTEIIKTSDRSGGESSYYPKSDEESGVIDANNENVDILGNKIGDDEISLEDQMKADAVRAVNGEDISKPAEDINKPADVNWGEDDKPVNLYRGEQGNLDNGRHLSREQNIYDVLGRKDPNAKEDSSAPVTYYTESPEDAKAYAATDQKILQGIRKQMGPGKYDDKGDWLPYTDTDYANMFNTMYGHEPRAEGTVNKYSVRLGKTLDMSDLGDTPSYNDMEKKILDTAGLKPTTNTDTAHPDWDLIDNRLKLSDMYGDEDNVPAYMILKNNPRESINRANEFIKFAQEHGYNSIKYKEDGVNHYAVIEKPAASLPELTPERMQEMKEVDDYLSQLKDERQRMIDEQLNHYKNNPGGKGVDSAPIYNEYGERTGTVGVSNNPEWYKAAWAYFGGKPPKNRLEEFADDYLKKNSEAYSKTDLQIRQLEEYRKRLESSPERPSDDIASEVFGEINYSKKNGNKYYKGEDINPDDIQPFNDITDNAKYEQLSDEFSKNGYNGQPIVVLDNANEGYLGLTGSHRIMAARKAGIDIPSIVLDNNEHTAKLYDMGDSERPYYAEELADEGIIPKEAADLFRMEDDNNFDDFKLNTKPIVEYSKPTKESYFDAAERGDYSTAAELARQAGEKEWAKNFQLLADTDGGNKSPTPNLSGKPNGEYTGDTVTMRQIMKRAQELFVPIRTGRLGMKGINGFANHKTGVIRVGTYGDIKTMSHEIGHIVDAALDLRGQAGAYDAEFSRVVNSRFGKGAYSPDEIRGEGIAEFVKDYLMNEESAKKNFPQYYDAFKKAIGENADIKGRVGGLKSMTDTWKDQSSEARGRSSVSYADENKPTPKERLKNAWDSFVEGVVDDKDALQRAQEAFNDLAGKVADTAHDVYKQARLAMNSSVARAEMMVRDKQSDLIRNSLNKIYGEGTVGKGFKSLKNILTDLDKSVKGKYDGYLEQGGFRNWHEALDSLLVARRSIEIKEARIREAQDAKVDIEFRILDYKNKLDGLMKTKAALDRQPVTPDITSRINKTNRAIEEISKEINRLNDLHKEAVKAELAARDYKTAVSMEDAKNIVKNAPDELTRAAKEVYTYNDAVLHIMQKTGMISLKNCFPVTIGVALPVRRGLASSANTLAV